MKKKLYLLFFIFFTPVAKAIAPLRALLSLPQEYVSLYVRIPYYVEDKINSSEISSEVTFFKRVKEVASSVVKKQVSVQLTRKMLLPVIIQNNIRLMFDLAFSPFGTALQARHIIKKINTID